MKIRDFSKLLIFLIVLSIFCQTSLALTLSPTNIHPLDILYFSGIIPKYNDCLDSRVDVRLLLYDPVLGYLKIKNSIFEKTLTGDFNVSGNVTISQFSNGQYKLVENIAYLCYDSDKWKDYSDWMGDRITENSFSITDPIFKFPSWKQSIHNKIYNFTLEQITHIELLIRYEYRMQCKVNDQEVFSHEKPGFFTQPIDITQYLQIGENIVRCSSHLKPDWYFTDISQARYCERTGSCWCIGTEDSPGGGSCSSCYYCADVPGADFDIAIRRKNPNLAQWNIEKNIYLSEFPISEDRWYSRTPEFYIVDESTETFEIKKGAIPWSGGKQSIWLNIQIPEKRKLFFSSPILPSCKINSTQLLITENEDNYWIWKSEEVQGNYLLNCTIPPSEEYLNFFDFKIEKIFPTYPFDYASGNKELINSDEFSQSIYPIINANQDPNETNNQRPTKTEFVVAGLSIIGVAGLASYSATSRRNTFYSKMKLRKQQYLLNINQLNQRNLEIQKIYPQVKVKIEQERQRRYQEYLRKLQLAKTYTQQLSILNSMASDKLLGEKLISATHQLKTRIISEVEKEINYTFDEFNLYKRNLKKIAHSPIELAEYYGINLPKENLPELFSGIATVNGSWYTGNIFGKDSNISQEEYSKILEPYAQLVPSTSPLIKNKTIYTIGVWFTREGLKWRDVGDGFTGSMIFGFTGEAALASKTGAGIAFSFFLTKAAAVCYFLGSVHRQTGDNLQAWSLDLKKSLKTLEKFKSRTDENMKEGLILSSLALAQGYFSSIGNKADVLTTLLNDPLSKFSKFLKEKIHPTKKDEEG